MPLHQKLCASSGLSRASPLLRHPPCAVTWSGTLCLGLLAWNTPPLRLPEVHLPLRLPSRPSPPLHPQADCVYPVLAVHSPSSSTGAACWIRIACDPSSSLRPRPWLLGGTPARGIRRVSPQIFGSDTSASSPVSRLALLPSCPRSPAAAPSLAPSAAFLSPTLAPVADLGTPCDLALRICVAATIAAAAQPPISFPFFHPSSVPHSASS